MKKSILNILEIVLFLVLILGHNKTFAQKNNFSFDHLGLREGLSQSFVNCIVQDKQGFIWFGTQDGLNKFDGYHFSVYKNNPKENNTISNNYIHAVVIDNAQNLWIATDNGLNRFDPVKEQFTRFSLHGKGSE